MGIISSKGIRNTFRKGLVDTDTSLDYHSNDILTKAVNVDIVSHGDDSVIKNINGNKLTGSVILGGKINDTDAFVGYTTWDYLIYLFFTTNGDGDNYIMEYNTISDTFSLILRRNLFIPRATYTNINNVIISADVVDGKFLYFVVAERNSIGKYRGLHQPMRINIADARLNPATYNDISSNMARPPKLIVSGETDPTISNNQLSFNSYVFYVAYISKYGERTVLSYPSDNLDESQGIIPELSINKININGFVVPDNIVRAEIFVSNYSDGVMSKVKTFDTIINKQVQGFSFINQYNYPVASKYISSIVNYEFPLLATEQEIVDNRLVYGDVKMYRKFVDSDDNPINKNTPFIYDVVVEDSDTSDTVEDYPFTQNMSGSELNVDVNFTVGDTYLIYVDADIDYCTGDDDCRDDNYSYYFSFYYTHVSDITFAQSLSTSFENNTDNRLLVQEQEPVVNNNFLIYQLGHPYYISISIDIKKVLNYAVNPLHSNMGLNSDFIYNYGIIFFDSYGRNSGVTNITQVKNKKDTSKTIFNIKPNLVASGIKPPYWAKRYMFVRTKVPVTIQYFTVGFNEQSKIDSNKTLYEISTTDKYINYLNDKKGKSVSVYSKYYSKNITINILSNEETAEEIERREDAGDLNIKIKPGKLYAYYDKNDIPSGNLILLSSVKDIEAKDSVFFETGDIFELSKSPDGTTVFSGDGEILKSYDTKLGYAYFNMLNPLTRKVPVMFLSDEKNSIEINHLGRGAYVYMDEFYSDMSATIVHSQPYNQFTNYNGLNTFSSVYNNFKDMDLKYGHIEKLFYTDTDLIVAQTRKISKILINKSMITSQQGDNTIIKSTNFFNNAVPYAGDYGITDKRSFTAVGFRKYFVDANSAVICRLSNDGISILNGTRFNEITGLFKYQKNSGYYISGYDYDKEEIVFTFSESGKTLRFSERIKGHVGSYDSSDLPKDFINVNNKLFTINKNSHKLWKENVKYSKTLWDNIIYPEINFVATVNPLMIKQYLSISLQSNIPFYTEILSDENMTYIDPSVYEEKEDYFYADIPPSVVSTDSSVFGVGVVDIVNSINKIYFVKDVENVNVGDKLFLDEGEFIGTVYEIDGNMIKISEIVFNTTPEVNKFVYCERPVYIEGDKLRGNYAHIKLSLPDTGITDDFILKSVDTQVMISSSMID